MHGVEFLQLLLVLVLVLLLTKPIGLYLAKVLDPQEKTFLDFALKPVEKSLYRICHIDREEQNWKEYAKSLLVFSAISLLFTFSILFFQNYLPLNPQKMGRLNVDLLINTAISFMTNTNWQAYSGENSLSYFSQMAGLTVQNFTSAAVGICVAAVLVRSFVLKLTTKIGNFWVDLIRVTLYFLLPLSLVGAACFISEGVPQNFSVYIETKTLEGSSQVLPQGPIASQEAIKLLGTNGGGYTNANSAHPYENPTPFSHLLQMLFIFLIPAGQIYYFGYVIKKSKHAWCIFVSLLLIFLMGVVVSAYFEAKGNPAFEQMGLYGGNWEGKESRLGIFSSALYSCITTVVSCGSSALSFDSMTPLGGLIPLLNMELNEVIFGGVGSGLFSLLLFVLLSIFIAGLIIGRTPEYLGKKIETQDIKMIVLAFLPFVLLVHLFTAIACFTDWGTSVLGNRGPHGFSEMLYAFTSTSCNNGSAFAGLQANTLAYNLSTALCMLLGRFLTIGAVLALAGSFAKKTIHPETESSFPISSLIFIILLISVIFLLGALTFLPALTLGPILEQFFLLQGMFSS